MKNIVIIGGGHAGVEAASAISRLKTSILRAGEDFDNAKTLFRTERFEGRILSCAPFTFIVGLLLGEKSKPFHSKILIQFFSSPFD